MTGRPAILPRPQTRDGDIATTGDLAEAIRHDLSGPAYAHESPGFWQDTAADIPTPFYGFDHVEHLGDHRLMLKGAEHYEQITRVPFLWSDPASASRGRTDAMGQTHDIGTTILDRARVAPAIGMQGLSLLQGDRASALIQYDHQKDNPAIGPGPRVHTLRQGRWRLTLIAGVEWGELYDLDTDPGEFVNLWDDPDHAPVRAELMEALARSEIDAVDRAPFPVALA